MTEHDLGLPVKSRLDKNLRTKLLHSFKLWEPHSFDRPVIKQTNKHLDGDLTQKAQKETMQDYHVQALILTK